MDYNSYTKMNAEQKAKESFSTSTWDTLPNSTKQILIEKEQKIIDQEQTINNNKLKDIYRQLKVVDVDNADWKSIADSYLTINDLDQSITDFNTSLSAISIENTKEYKQLLNTLINNCMNNTLTIENAKQQLEVKYKEVKKIRYKNYNITKTPSKTIVTVIKEKVTKLRDKGSETSSYNIDECNDQYPLHIKDNYYVMIPCKQYIERVSNVMFERIRKQWKDVPSKPIHRSTITCLLSADKFHSWTEKLIINDIDGVFIHDWYNNLKDLINQRIIRSIENPHYEVRGCAQLVEVRQGYIISQLESIYNWFHKDSVIEQVVEYKDFKLFTASNPDINCVKQCVERLGYVYNETKTIDEIITDKEIVRYTPYKVGMDRVREIDDLVMITGDNDTLDCNNVVRLVEYNNHIGIITKMWNKSSRTIMSKKKLETKDNDRKVEIFVDIESFEDENNNHVPYLICWKTKDGDVLYETMEGCVERFVSIILRSYNRTQVVLYAWYGSGYDYQHIIKYLKRYSKQDDVFIRNNNIIYAKLVFDNNLTVVLKDPYLFILTGLGKAAKAFGVTNKDDFSHQMIKDWDDLDKILDRWYYIREEFYDSYNETGKVMLVNVKTWEEFEEGSNHMSILDRAIKYCSIDVIAMEQVWVKFVAIVKEQLGISIDVKTFTLSQMSMKLMEAHLPDGVKLSIPKKENYEFIRKAIYGGRVVAKNGAYEEDIIYADVVSLYPSAMRLLEHGYGNPKEVNSINWNKQGIYEVVLTSKSEPNSYMEFVPFRDEHGKLSYNWRPYWKGVYNTYDLMIAQEEGYEIKCLYGIEYESKGFIFNEFIDKLFKLKAESTGVIRWVAKIALNGGGYGKFVQKPIDQQVLLVPKSALQQYFENTDENGKVIVGKHKVNKPKFYDLDNEEWEKMVIEMEGDIRYAAQIGVSILSGSRYRLFKLVKEIKKRAVNMEIIYSDTDSIFIRRKSLNGINISKYFGKELGQLDDTVDNSLNNIINKIYIAGPKMYGYEYYDNNGMIKQNLRLKGVPGKMVTIEQLKFIVEKNENKVIYNMMQMRKNMINVKSEYMDKEIKQT